MHLDTGVHMKGVPVPPTEKLGPFPLESNLRKLKPSLARLGPIIAGAGIIFAQEGFWNQLKEWTGSRGGLVIIGLLTAVFLFYVLDLYLKQIWYNERGIGINKVWGGDRNWFSFDEMRGGQFKMRKRSRGIGQGKRLYRPSSRLTLNFQSGSVRIWPNLYDSKGMYELLAILSRRFPDYYAPPEMTKEMKKEMDKRNAAENKFRWPGSLEKANKEKTGSSPSTSPQKNTAKQKTFAPKPDKFNPAIGRKKVKTKSSQKMP
jgi:hypothetical protein